MLDAARPPFDALPEEVDATGGRITIRAKATGDAGGGVLQPTICGYSMQTLAEQVSDRKRSINVGADSNDYERWDSRSDTQQTRNLGLAQFDQPKP